MKCIVLGGAGFIGSHLAKRLKSEGNYVRVVDIKNNDYMEPSNFCDEFLLYDLRDPIQVADALDGGADEIYQLAADMGGAGYIFTGENDANVMHNSALIDLNVAYEVVKYKGCRLFYSSSACAYPAYNQTNPDNPKCSEDSIYPAMPDSEYGWEKIFSERLYKAFERNYGLQVRIARFHNIFGPMSTYSGGKEKAPAAICRKVAETRDLIWPLENDGSEVAGASDYYPKIDIWGDGQQTRSFLYVDECLEGIIRLMRSDCLDIVNIGSDEMISINNLANMVIHFSGKNVVINNIPGPEGVRGRNSDNRLIQEKLGWAPSQPLSDGMYKLYQWVLEQTKTHTHEPLRT